MFLTVRWKMGAGGRVGEGGVGKYGSEVRDEVLVGVSCMRWGVSLGIGGDSGVEVHRLSLAVTVCAMIGVGGGVVAELVSLECSGNTCSCVAGCSAAGWVLAVMVVVRGLEDGMIVCRVCSVVGVVA